MRLHETNLTLFSSLPLLRSPLTVVLQLNDRHGDPRLLLQFQHNVDAILSDSIFRTTLCGIRIVSLDNNENHIRP